MKSSFFSKLSYSFGNEDWKTERQALKLRPQDRVLCITASGDRPLNLLMDNCKEIVCVDANRTQNHLLNLKTVAMSEFSYDQYLAFLGATPCKHRRELLRIIKNKLEPEARDFWLNHSDMIVRGVLYQGRMEKLAINASKAINLVRGEKVRKLFAMNDLPTQIQFVREQWGSSIFKKLLNIALHPIFSKVLIHDPGLNGDWDYSTKTGTYIYDRMNAVLNYALAKESAVLSLLCKGEVSKEGYSPYLTKEGTDVIKSRVDKLSIKHTDIIEFLEKIPEPSFDCFSLSDVASYMPYNSFVRLLHAVKKTAKPGARFSIRQFTSYHSIPDALKTHFVRETDLEQKLEREDRCFVYRYMVGKVNN